MTKKKVAEKQEEKKVLITKTYTVTVQHFDDGTQNMNRRNDGFNPLELIGVADFIALEVREQIMGRLKPDTIKREVVV
jgi:hypothetical protein